MTKKIPGEFIVQLPTHNEAGHVFGTREFITYQGLLTMAHDRGLSEIDTTLLQSPSDANGRVAIVRATARGSSGSFTGLGDASPENVHRRIAPHLLRVAETRAKARALRDLTNIAMVAIDELGGDDDQREPAIPSAARELIADRPATPAPRATDSQRRALWRKAQALGHDRRTVGAYLAKRLGGDLATMSKQQASNLLNELQRDLRLTQTQGRRAAE